MGTSKKMSKMQKMIYGLGDFGSQFIWTFTGSYLTIFYTDIVGLAPAIVSAIMFGARIWDAITHHNRSQVREADPAGHRTSYFSEVPSRPDFPR